MKLCKKDSFISVLKINVELVMEMEPINVMALVCLAHQPSKQELIGIFWALSFHRRPHLSLNIGGIEAKRGFTCNKKKKVYIFQALSCVENLIIVPPY